jgi:hypothetical protein
MGYSLCNSTTSAAAGSWEWFETGLSRPHRPAIIVAEPLAFAALDGGGPGQLEQTQRREIAPREETQIMTDPDPFEQGQRAARKNIPAEANPYPVNSPEHVRWAFGHTQVAGDMEARESEGT